MNCIKVCVIYKYRVKQLTIFERTVAADSDFKNCMLVNCVDWLMQFTWYRCNGSLKGSFLLNTVAMIIFALAT